MPVSYVFPRGGGGGPCPPCPPSPLLWEKLREVDFEDAANAQGPFILGSQIVPLVDTAGAPFNATLVHSMVSGAFSNITSEITAGDGWRMTWAATGTNTNCRGPISIPIGATLGLDDDFRVTIVGTTSQPVSPNSSYWQISKDGVTPNADSANCWGGNRILRNGASNTALYLNYQGGGSPATLNISTTPPCPLNWLDGTIELTQVLYLPRYTNRARVNMSGTGSLIQCDLGLTGVAASNNSLRGGWCSGNSNIWLYHGGSNGGANGLGNQWTKISRIIIERRQLP
jgi:hypothetical protein